jgi:hypothetical protein
VPDFAKANFARRSVLLFECRRTHARRACRLAWSGGQTGGRDRKGATLMWAPPDLAALIRAPSGQLRIALMRFRSLKVR